MRSIGERLVIATHNPGKLREIAELVEPLGITCVSAKDLDLPEPEEIGNTFVDNADLKAREAADLSGLPALADDSGLCVDALQGSPGIFSARWAEDEQGNRDWMRAMERVWSEVEAAGPDAGHDAHFACALAARSAFQRTMDRSDCQGITASMPSSVAVSIASSSRSPLANA